MSQTQTPSSLTSLFEHFLCRKKNAEEKDAYYKEQAIRFGYDIRTCEGSFKSFFFQKSLEDTLKKVRFSVQEIPQLEQHFWIRHADAIESFTLSSSTMILSDAITILSWLENLTTLTLQKAYSLLKQSSTDLVLSKSLKKVVFLDLHLVDKNAFSFVPEAVEEIEIIDCRLVSEDFFQKLEKCKKLKKFSMKASSPVTASMMQRIPKSVTELEISNPLQNPDPCVLELLPKNLTKLDLSNWKGCSYIDMPTLGKNLTSLSLSGWSLQAESLSGLQTLALRHLEIANCFIDEVLTLSFLPKTLYSLDISANAIQPSALDALLSCRELKKLDASQNPGLFFREPTSFPASLEYVNLSGNKKIHEKTVLSLSSLPNLTTLLLADCDITDNDLQVIPKTVECLDISYNDKVTESILQTVLFLNKIKILLIDGCQSIRSLVSLPKSLKTLSAKNCQRLSGKSLDCTPESLEELYLDSCSLISGKDIQMLPKNLQVLSVNFCLQVDETILNVFDTHPYLHTIEVAGCPKVSRDMLSAKKFTGKIMHAELAENVGQIVHEIERHPAFKTLKKTTKWE